MRRRSSSCNWSKRPDSSARVAFGLAPLGDIGPRSPGDAPYLRFQYGLSVHPVRQRTTGARTVPVKGDLLAFESASHPLADSAGLAQQGFPDFGGFSRGRFGGPLLISINAAFVQDETAPALDAGAPPKCSRRWRPQQSR